MEVEVKQTILVKWKWNENENRLKNDNRIITKIIVKLRAITKEVERSRNENDSNFWNVCNTYRIFLSTT